MFLCLLAGCQKQQEDSHVLLEKFRTLTREGQWQAILDDPGAKTSTHLLVRQCVNRALLHQNLLSSRFFAMPQVWGQKSLMLPQEYGYLYPLAISDLYLDVGHVNAALHWAFEAQAADETDSWIDERLATVFLLKRKPVLTERYLKPLENKPEFKETIATYREILNRPELLFQQPELAGIYNRMPVKDFIIHNLFPEDDLLRLLEVNPGNRQAFEVLMTLYLCQKKLDLFMAQLYRMQTLGYGELPRHFEEAMLLYLARTQVKNIPLQGFQWHEPVVKEFREFRRILQAYRQDADSLHKILQTRYADTYWFYFLYHEDEQKLQDIPSLLRK